MAEVGKPLSRQERASRGLDHKLHYGLKMMVRSDIGGSAKKELGGLRGAIKSKIRNLSLDDQAAAVEEMIDANNRGTSARQRRTIEDIQEHGKRLENAILAATTEFKLLIDAEVIKPDGPVCKLLRAADEMVAGDWELTMPEFMKMMCGLA